MQDTVIKTQSLVNQQIEATKAANKAASAGQQMADIGAENLHQSQRPWVGLSEPIEPIDATTPQNGSTFKIAPIFRNFGTSTATRVLPMIELATTHEQLNSVAARVCADAKFVVTAKGEYDIFGRVLFPNDTFYYPYDVGVQTQSTPDRYLMGCVIYMDEFNTWHHTRFCAQLMTDQAYPAKPIRDCNFYNDAN